METYNNPSISSVSPVDRQRAIAQLNDLLRGELAAVETYRIAVERMKTFSKLTDLQTCLTSHEERVSKVKNRISSLGGAVVDSSGAWGAFAKLIEGSAALFGEDAAIRALEEGEDKGVKDYRTTADLDPAVRQFVDVELLPAQLQTHAIMSELKRAGQKD